MGRIGYIKINNLYKDIDIFMFKECYALEKIHGTSSHIRWKDGEVEFFSGGENHDKFVELFNKEELTKKFTELFDCNVVVYGEAYGGKQQGMSHTYGKELKFVAFDVKVDGMWLNVPNAEDVVKNLGLEFVSYNKIPTILKYIDAERDLLSVQAVRNGVGNDKIREGIVLRPLMEVTKNNGSRVIVKHKREEFRETKTKREVDPKKLKIIKEANAIAEEWCTPNRLGHVLDKLGNPDDITDIGKVIKAMIDDIFIEAKDEIVESKQAKQAIGKKCALLFKSKINKLKNVHE